MNTFFDQLRASLAAKSPLYIRVKVITKSPKTEIAEQMEDGTYKIRVHAAPVKGAANEELCRFLRKALGASEVTIVSGGRDKVKLLRVSG
ncbi:MAG: DUF167 domain-containing protein [Patescibacteria group bacterium]|nr:DUF167 domain-containing protein [Patescibacteria group bacterium]